MTTTTLDSILNAATAGGSTLDFMPVAREVISRAGVRADYVWEEKVRKSEVVEVRVIEVTASRELRDIVTDICRVLNPAGMTDSDNLYTSTNLLRAIALHWDQTDPARAHFGATPGMPLANRDSVGRLARELADAQSVRASQEGSAA